LSRYIPHSIRAGNLHQHRVAALTSGLFLPGLVPEDDPPAETPPPELTAPDLDLLRAGARAFLRRYQPGQNTQEAAAADLGEWAGQGSNADFYDLISGRESWSDRDKDTFTNILNEVYAERFPVVRHHPRSDEAVNRFRRFLVGNADLQGMQRALGELLGDLNRGEPDSPRTQPFAPTS
jgi:hypothetical protein